MAGRFYNKQQWRRLRRQQLQRQPLCVLCEELGDLVPASQVDHVRAISDGGAPADLNNLRSLCASCHTA